tara:strand:+ start:139 stop:927 length:789 start_codon:yes stop_codon:yes gene_type:complete
MNFQKELSNIKYHEIINELDINAGDIVYICSDITGLLLNSRKNNENFDPQKFIDSIINKVGSNGTVLFPTFNWGFCKNERFDLQKTPSQCGALTNEALKRKDFERTQHPIYSFSVWGKDKEKLIGMNNKSSWSEDSPFGYLYRNKAKNLFIGIDYKNGFTMDHYFEQKNNVEYRYHKNFQGEYVDKQKKISLKTFSMFVRDVDKIDSTGINPMLDKILIEKKGYKKYNINNIYFGIIYLNVAGKIIDDDIKKKRDLIFPYKK